MVLAARNARLEIVGRGTPTFDDDGVPDWEDSNIALIGSDEDKAACKNAAASEPAWQGAGQAVGVEVWRIEKFKVVPWPKRLYGQFHKGDSYIAMVTTKEEDEEELHHRIHFWLGQETTNDEKGTAAYKTVELDDFFDGEPTQHREVQAHESTEFQEAFPVITYLEGGIETGFSKSAEDTHVSRLYRVRKVARASGRGKGSMRIDEVTQARDSLNHGDCFVLDTETKIYVWFGDHASHFEKQAANSQAERIESEYFSKVKVTHDCEDAGYGPDSEAYAEECAHFWELLGGAGDIKADADDDVPKVDNGECILYQINEDENGQLTNREVARGEIQKNHLVSDDVMMLDTGAEIFLWVGKGASGAESKNAYRTAMRYLKVNNKPDYTPIHLFREGQTITNRVWKKVFAN